MENRRLQRVNSDIYRHVATYIQERAIAASVTKVETGADFGEAKIWVTAEVDALTRAADFLRAEIAKRFNMKRTPKLRFILDRGRENADRVEELLGQIRTGN